MRSEWKKVVTFTIICIRGLARRICKTRFLLPLKQLLMVACSKGHLDVVIYAEKQGVDIHVDIECALRLAASKGYLFVVKYLVNQGVNIHTYDEFALWRAAVSGHFRIVQYLADEGADMSKLYLGHVEKMLVPFIGCRCFVSRVEFCRRQHEKKQFTELQKINQIHYKNE